MLITPVAKFHLPKHTPRHRGGFNLGDADVTQRALPCDVVSRSDLNHACGMHITRCVEDRVSWAVLLHVTGFEGKELPAVGSTPFEIAQLTLEKLQAYHLSNISGWCINALGPGWLIRGRS